MSITLEDFVRREVIHGANCLIADLQRIVPGLPYAQQKDLSFDPVALDNLLEIVDWEEPVERYVDKMTRVELLEALDEVPIDDERDEADIRVHALRELEAEGDLENLDTRMLEWPGINDDTLREKLMEHLRDDADNFENFARDWDVEPDRSEVYEFWAVTDWLGEKLREKGHPVEDICDFTIWGRPTTGQAIAMDGVIHEIYKEMMA